MAPPQDESPISYGAIRKITGGNPMDDYKIRRVKKLIGNDLPYRWSEFSDGQKQKYFMDIYSAYDKMSKQQLAIDGVSSTKGHQKVLNDMQKYKASHKQKWNERYPHDKLVTKDRYETEYAENVSLARRWGDFARDLADGNPYSERYAPQLDEDLDRLKKHGTTDPETGKTRNLISGRVIGL